jgi:hypothetical protein
MTEGQIMALITKARGGQKSDSSRSHFKATKSSKDQDTDKITFRCRLRGFLEHFMEWDDKIAWFQCLPMCPPHKELTYSSKENPVH